MCAQRGKHHLPHRAIALLVAVIAALAVLLPTFRAKAEGVIVGDVEFRFNNRVVWVDQPFTAEVDIINAESYSNPVVQPIDGVDIQIQPGTRESTYTQIINGRSTTRSTRTVVIQFTPLRTGIFQIQPIEVTVDGKVHRSRLWRFVAEQSEVGELLIVDVVGVPGSGYVGQPIELTLQIWIEVFRDREERITLSEADMWSLIDLNRSEWGAFEGEMRSMEKSRKRPRGQEVVRGDRNYYVYQVSKTDHPVRAGQVDPGKVRIVMEYPEGIRRQRGVFNRGNLVLAGARPISLAADVEPIEIKPLPEEGRPRHFTGAVGQFRVRASAQPTDASVGDPITLVLEITDESSQGNSDLANLRPPPLRDLSELKDFRIPDDPTTGVVDDITKIFTETLRPTDDSITEIPSIPFSSFDPELGRYVTVRTNSIPISVSPSERLNLDAIMPSTGISSRRKGDDGSPLTLVEGGLRANAPVSSALLADQRMPFGIIVLAASVVPPIGFAATMLWQRRRRLHQERPDFIRASRARKEAASQLSNVGDGEASECVFNALTGLIAARLHLPAGALTAREAARIASEQGLEKNTVQELEVLLRSCESSRYAPGTIAEKDLVSRARPLLSQLDRIRPIHEGANQ